MSTLGGSITDFVEDKVKTYGTMAFAQKHDTEETELA